MQLHHGRGHIFDRSVSINLERHCQLIGDLDNRGLAVTPIPDVAGRWVKLMDEVGLTVEDHDLTIDTPDVEISPSFRAIGILVHLLWSAVHI
jgi:hypothetical protein